MSSLTKMFVKVSSQEELAKLRNSNRDFNFQSTENPLVVTVEVANDDFMDGFVFNMNYYNAKVYLLEVTEKYEVSNFIVELGNELGFDNFVLMNLATQNDQELISQFGFNSDDLAITDSGYFLVANKTTENYVNLFELNSALKSKIEKMQNASGGYIVLISDEPYGENFFYTFEDAEKFSQKYPNSKIRKYSDYLKGFTAYLETGGKIIE